MTQETIALVTLPGVAASYWLRVTKKKMCVCFHVISSSLPMKVLAEVQDLVDSVTYHHFHRLVLQMASHSARSSSFPQQPRRSSRCHEEVGLAQRVVRRRIKDPVCHCM